MRHDIHHSSWCRAARWAGSASSVEPVLRQLQLAPRGERGSGHARGNAPLAVPSLTGEHRQARWCPEVSSTLLRSRAACSTDAGRSSQKTGVRKEKKYRGGGACRFPPLNV